MASVPIQKRPDKKLTAYTNMQAQFVDIWGGNVVWTAIRSDIYDYDEALKTREIYFYNGNKRFKITNNNYEDMEPKLWGSNITWRARVGNEEEFEIMLARLYD